MNREEIEHYLTGIRSFESYLSSLQAHLNTIEQPTSIVIQLREDMLHASEALARLEVNLQAAEQQAE